MASSQGELVEFPRPRRERGALTLEGLLRPSAEGPAFASRPVPRETLAELHALMALGPGMADASPTRVLFLSSKAAKARLAPHLAPAERGPARLAPACALVGYDQTLAEHLAEFVGDGGGAAAVRPAREAARRNGVLQGAYLAVAARALGLEAAFVARFDRTGLAAEFFRDAAVTPIFVARLGYPG